LNDGILAEPLIYRRQNGTPHLLINKGYPFPFAYKTGSSYAGKQVSELGLAVLPEKVSHLDQPQENIQMGFKVTDQHVDEYYRNGFTIFRELIPASLLSDLREMADQGLTVARELNGPQAQRLQPIIKHIECKPYFDLLELQSLRDAVELILGEGIYHDRPPNGDDPVAGILYHPQQKPWCTQWHRDWRDNVADLDINVWKERQLDWRIFNQVNCALYEDHCTWVVPGSHLRDDTRAEAKRFPDRPIPRPDFGELEAAEAELQGLAYCRSMPGAVQAQLNAGDYMLYRNSLWHLGNYCHYKKRATIHDGIWTESFWKWFQEHPKQPDGKKEMMNPNR
jgi:hypothetical protein